ncbi:transmembrane protein [Ruloma virus]|uniref:Transmembrane protein n=1 Tax=Ruloma virus TaxID=2811341 RepID=A0AAE7Q9W7_9MONO|nr:transmembrane protein [Ruloma virus]QRN45789.1 transmembrane protein [Ruloma virus]
MSIYAISDWNKIGRTSNKPISTMNMHKTNTRSIGVSTDLGICLEIPYEGSQESENHTQLPIYEIPPDAGQENNDLVITYAEDGDGRVIHYSSHLSSGLSDTWTSTTSYVDMDLGRRKGIDQDTQTDKICALKIKLTQFIIIILILINVTLFALLYSVHWRIKIPDYVIKDLEINGAIRVSGYSEKIKGRVELIMLSLTEYEKIRNMTLITVESYSNCTSQLDQSLRDQGRYIQIINELRAVCFKHCQTTESPKVTVDHGRDFSKTTETGTPPFPYPRSPPRSPCDDSNALPWFCTEGGLPIVHYPNHSFD